ncbi:hypothetical protein, partial [Yersinia pseudotuberculosis]|uniref:hypothetical protein n=3 Tax=Yersinia pseudotuberculosis TaxID=633 RepID=UPI000B24D7C5
PSLAGGFLGTKNKAAPEATLLSILYYPVSLIQTEVDDKAIYRSVSEGVISKRVTMTPAACASFI